MPSERLLHLLNAEHGVRRSELSALSDADIRELEAAVTGTGDRRYFARALDFLVTARGAGATRALAQVLGDRRERDTLRAAAASQLGRVGPTAERPLLAALDSDESTVVIAATGGLARVG
jgi:HEAT repeat protein